MQHRTSPKADPKNSQQERWLISYADFITLLLAFFVAMYSVSRLDQEQLIEAQASIHQAIHSFLPQVRPNLAPLKGKSSEKVDSPAVLCPMPDQVQVSPPADLSQLRQIEEELIRNLKASPDFKDVQVLSTPQGMLLRFRDLVFFDTAKADLRPEVYPLLDKMALIFDKIPNEVMVEGHTDDRPIHTAQYPSNWELSTARATALVRYLVEHAHIEPRRLSAAGYGPYHPVADNRHETGRQANRRVDLIIKSVPLTSPPKTAKSSTPVDSVSWSKNNKADPQG
ncbi:MAG: OmpA family protein [Desulfobacca sp.]|nr:OmpA family protein [Desulfobacca sp.]